MLDGYFLLWTLKMGTVVIVAIITSGFSLILGIFTAIWGYKKNVKSQEIMANSQEKVKELELKYSSKINHQKIVDDESRIMLNSYKNAISSAQILKNKLHNILDSTDNSYFSKIAIQDIEESRVNIEEIFTNEFSELEKLHFDPYHEIKNIAYECEKLIHKYLKNTEFTSELGLYQKRKLAELRVKLSDAQAVLRDNRSLIYEQYLYR